jgi:putative ABC transport system permease protein
MTEESPTAAIPPARRALKAALLLGLRDLGWRRRRFVIAFLATGVVLTLALLMTGIKAGLDNEPGQAVAFFHADAWIVPRGVEAPFSGQSPFAESEVGAIRGAAGVRSAYPVVLLGGTVGLRNVDVIGISSDANAGSDSGVSHALSRGLTVADRTLGVAVGARVRLNGVLLRIGDLTSNLAYFGGTPTLVVSLATAQQLAFGGRPLATAIVTRGVPRSLPAGFIALSDAQVTASLKRPVAGADQVITLIRSLLWAVAAGIVAAILYLSALEQTSEFAVLKAIGISTSTMLLALGLQALVISLLSGALAVVLTAILSPATGLAVSLSWSSYVLLFVAALLVGCLGSLLALRRVVSVDPALAFGR